MQAIGQSEASERQVPERLASERQVPERLAWVPQALPQEKCLA